MRDTTTFLYHALPMAGAAVILLACAATPQPDELTLKRINIVDESGEVRLVISGNVPDPVVRGEQLPRAISPAGMVWHDQDGNESGGLVSAPMPAGGTMRGIIFDFTHQPTDAVSMGTFETEDGEVWMAGVMVHDRLPYDPGPISTSQGKRRIMLGTENADAGLVILDPEERERIRIGVDAEGVPYFEMLNEQGEVVHRLPE